MATDSGYEKGNYLRVCDICGHRFHFRDLRPIGEMRFACPDDAPGLTSMQISRFNARAKPLVVRPNRFAKDYAQTGIYQLAEAQILNFIAQVAPKGERDGTSDPLSAAWATIYMADVLAQAKRPRNWDRTATAAIVTCCTYLLSLQYGDSTGANPTGTIDNPRYGGILSGTLYRTGTTIAAGIAFLKAYGALGTVAYRVAAERIGTFIRHAQCGDLQASVHVVYPVAGGPYHSGGLASYVDDGSGLQARAYNLADVLGAWFLRLLADVKGEGTSYGDAASTAFFTAPTAATLTTMIAELVTFGTDGVRDAASSGAITPGLSATAPKANYDAARSDGSGTASWLSSDPIASDDIALALRGIYGASGTTAKVTEMLAWLAAFASNVDNRTPASDTEEEVFAGITGTYNPVLCPADTLTAAAPFTEADGALYSWSSLGLLSPILAASPSAFRTSKDTLSTSVRYTTLDVTNKYLGPIGSSGLSLQPFYRDSAGRLIGVSGGPGAAGSGAATPPSEGVAFWVKWDVGVVSGAGKVTTWKDQGGQGQDLNVTSAGKEPRVGVDTVDGIGWVSMPVGGQQAFISHAGAMKNSAGVAMTAASPRTVFALILPRTSSSGFGFNITGGPVFSFREQACFECLFDLESFFHPNGLYLFANIWRFGGDEIRGPDTVDTAYTGKTTLVEWSGAASAGSSVSVAVNGISLSVTPVTSLGAAGAAPPAGFVLGNCDNNGGGLNNANFQGGIGEVLVYDRILSGGALDQARGYFATRAAGLSIALNSQSSVVRAAKTGLLYRQDPGRYPLLRGN